MAIVETTAGLRAFVCTDGENVAGKNEEGKKQGWKTLIGTAKGWHNEGCLMFQKAEELRDQGDVLAFYSQSERQGGLASVASFVSAHAAELALKATIGWEGGCEGRSHNLHALFRRLREKTREAVEEQWQSLASERRGMAWVRFESVERMLESYGKDNRGEMKDINIQLRFLGEETISSTAGMSLPDIPGLLALARILLARLEADGKCGRLDTVRDWPERPDENGRIIRDNHNRFYGIRSP